MGIPEIHQCCESTIPTYILKMSFTTLNKLYRKGCAPPDYLKYRHVIKTLSVSPITNNYCTCPKSMAAMFPTHSSQCKLLLVTTTVRTEFVVSQTTLK